jgi:hypothetical protein
MDGRFSFSYAGGAAAAGLTSYQLPDSPLAPSPGLLGGGKHSLLAEESGGHHHRHHHHHHHHHGAANGADAHASINLTFAQGAGGGGLKAAAPAAAPALATTSVVRMRRGDAWSGFLALEGGMQVCLSEVLQAATAHGSGPSSGRRSPRGGGGAPWSSSRRGAAQSAAQAASSLSPPLHDASTVASPAVAASEFLRDGCSKLRDALGVSALLLPAAGAGAAEGATTTAAQDIFWDDGDVAGGGGLAAGASGNATGASSRVSAGGFASSLTAIKLHVRRFAYPDDAADIPGVSLSSPAKKRFGRVVGKALLASLTGGNGGNGNGSPPPSPGGDASSPTPPAPSSSLALASHLAPCFAGGSREDPVNGYQTRTVHLRLLPVGMRRHDHDDSAYSRSNLDDGYDVRTRLARTGLALPGSPVVDLLPGALGYDVVLEVSDGKQVLARGVVEAKRLWQAAMEASGATGRDGVGGNSQQQQQQQQAAVPIVVRNVGNNSEGGVVLLSVRCVDRELPSAASEGPKPGLGAGGRMLVASPSRAYDVLLDAALRAEGCGERQLRLRGAWAWLLGAFARKQGVRRPHCLLAHLSWALGPAVASATSDCLSLVAEGLRELLEQERLGALSAGGGGPVLLMQHQTQQCEDGQQEQEEALPLLLTRHEAAALDRVKRDAEQLLRLVFENYYLLCDSARKGLLEGSAAASAAAAAAVSTQQQEGDCEGGAADPSSSSPDFPPKALSAATELFEVMAPVLLPSAGEWIDDRLRVAAKARWARLSASVEAAAGAAGLGSGSLAALPALPSTTTSSSGGGAHQHHLTRAFAAIPGNGEPNHATYARLVALADGVLADVSWDCRLQRCQGLLPEGVCLPAATAGEHCAQLVRELRAALAAAPPPAPTPSAVALLVAVAGLQRRLGCRGLAPPRGHPGHIDAMGLFGSVVRGWICSSRDALLAEVRQVEATTELGAALGVGGAGGGEGGSGASTCVGGAAPIVGAALAAIDREASRYERVIAHWPLFGPYLEAALCAALRAAALAASRQCGGGGGAAGGKDGRSPSPRPLFLLGGGGGGGSGSPLRTAAAAAAAAAASTSADGIPRLFVREAALLNSLSRLMAAVPLVEARLLAWTAEAWEACRVAASASPIPGAGRPEEGPPSSASPGLTAAAAAAAAAFEDPAAYGLAGDGDDVAPQVGAQFAQSVKELRSEYASAVRRCAARLSAQVASRPQTSIPAVLTAVWRDASEAAHLQHEHQQRAAAVAGAVGFAAAPPSAEARAFGAARIGGGAGVHSPSMQPPLMQQPQAAVMHRALVERAAAQLLGALSATLSALAEALEPRALVAVARALWDCQAQALLEHAEGIQESGGGARQGGIGGAWRARQHAAALLQLLDAFFREGLVSVVAAAGGGGGGGGNGGGLQERDLAAPVHSDAAQRLLAASSMAGNLAYTPV